MTPRVALVPVFALLAPLLASPSFSQPTLTFEPAPTVRGLTAGASVAWIGLARVSVDSGIVIRRFDGVDSDTDGDGVISLTLEGLVPLRSLWVIVELSTGRTAAAAPADFPDAPADLGLAWSADRTPESLAVAVERVHGLWVRPGPTPGAWRYWGVDGSLGDADATPDGAIQVATTSLQPLPSISPFAGSQPGDLVIAIDALSLGFQIESIPAPIAGASR